MRPGLGSDLLAVDVGIQQQAGSRQAPDSPPNGEESRFFFDQLGEEDINSIKASGLASVVEEDDVHEIAKLISP
jgi:hypothetical protein